jgi:hypothetical protein
MFYKRYRGGGECNRVRGEGDAPESVNRFSRVLTWHSINTGPSLLCISNAVKLTKSVMDMKCMFPFLLGLIFQTAFPFINARRVSPQHCAEWCAGLHVKSLPIPARSEMVKHLRERLGFEVFSAVTMKNAVFWDVTPCGSCENRRFVGT